MNLTYFCCTYSPPTDWTGIIISTALSAVLGYFISIWASRQYEKSKHEREIKDLNVKFGRHSGYFENFYHKGNKIQTKISDARLEYLPDTGNFFKIIVTTYTDDNANPLSKDQIQKWEGEVRMVDKIFGDLSFHGIAPDHLKTFVGFKRIIFSSDLNVMTVIGERPSGYGDERFERVTNSN